MSGSDAPLVALVGALDQIEGIVSADRARYDGYAETRLALQRLWISAYSDQLRTAL